MVINTIIFDLNKVLVKYKEDSNKQYQELIGMTGKEFWSEARKLFNGYNIGKINIKEFFGIVFDHLKLDKSKIGELEKIHENSFFVLPGMIDILEKLKDNYRLILFVGDGRDSFYLKVYGFGLDKYFPEMTVTSYEGYNKKQEELYQILIDNHNLKPEDCIFIDDLEKHTTPAKAAGFNTILFRDSEQLIEELKRFDISI